MTAQRALAASSTLAGAPPAIQWGARALVFVAGAALFSIQPILTKLLVPVSGGTALGWVLMLLVGQMVAALGALTAPALAQIERPRRLYLWPVAALLLTLLWGLPLDRWLEELGAQPTPLRILGWLLAAMVPGAFALAVASPWLQSQLARAGATYPRHLAGWSTAGALVGLLLVPLVVEPVVGFKAAATVWRAVSSLVLLGFLVWPWQGRGSAMGDLSAAAAGGHHTETGRSWAPRWATIFALPREVRRTAVWWTFVPVFFLGASSTWVATELPPGPWWWSASLGAYLLSWVTAAALGGARTRWDGPRGRTVVLSVMGILVALVQSIDLLPGMVLLLQIVGGTFAHRRLLRARLTAEQVAPFWAWSSAGSLVGGLMGSLVPIWAFSTLIEFPLSLLCWLSVAGPWWQWRRWTRPIWAFGSLVVVFLGLVVLEHAGQRVTAVDLTDAYLLLVIFPALLLLTRQGRKAPALMAMGLGMLALGPYLPRHVVLHARSPFGTIQLRTYGSDDPSSSEPAYLGLISGSTLHGLEPRTGRVVGTVYYADRGGYVRALNLVPPRADRRVALVGLGLGNLICAAHPNDHWTVMELDPVMVAVAQSPLARSWRSCAMDSTRLRQPPRLWIGDGRLLAKGLLPEAEHVDLIALDAFSSDAIPMHLLTAEAFARWRAVLRPGGLVIAHISNRHIDVSPVLRAEADHWAAAWQYRIPSRAATPGSSSSASEAVSEPDGMSLVVFAADSLGAARVAQLRGLQYWAPLKASAGRRVRWTDDRTPFWSLWSRGGGAEAPSARETPQDALPRP